MIHIFDPAPLLAPFMQSDHPADPREQRVQRVAAPVSPPAHLFESPARLRWRQERAAMLLDFWQRDLHGFNLFAGECLWEDPRVAELLPADAAAAAIKLVSAAAIRLHRQAR